jgi:hypothetical protein
MVRETRRAYSECTTGKWQLYDRRSMQGVDLSRHQPLPRKSKQMKREHVAIAAYAMLFNQHKSFLELNRLDSGVCIITSSSKSFIKNF